MKKLRFIFVLLIFPIILCGCSMKEVDQVERPKLKPIYEYKTVEEYANDVKKIADSYDNITVKGEEFGGEYTSIDKKTGKIDASLKVYFNVYKQGQKTRLEQKFVSLNKEDKKTWMTDEFHFLLDGEKRYLVYGSSFPKIIDDLVDVEVKEMKNTYDTYYNWFKNASEIYLISKKLTEAKILGMTQRNGFSCRLIDLGMFEHISKKNEKSINKYYVCVNEEYGFAVDSMWISRSADGKEKRRVSKIKEINTNAIPNKKFKLAIKVLYDDESKNKMEFKFKYGGRKNRR